MRASRYRHRRSILIGAVAVVALAGSACAEKYQAERDGKDAGEAFCDLRDADTVEEAQEAREALDSALDELASDVALFTQEDRNDIDENLTDLQEHISQDNELLIEQDAAVIRRSLDNIRDDLGDAGQAAIDGFYQGIEDCVAG
jgi:hypothetical protein